MSKSQFSGHTSTLPTSKYGLLHWQQRTISSAYILKSSFAFWHVSIFAHSFTCLNDGAHDIINVDRRQKNHSPSFTRITEGFV